MITLHHKCTIFYHLVEQISFCKRTKQGKSNAEPRNIMTALLEAGIAVVSLPSDLDCSRKRKKASGKKTTKTTEAAAARTTTKNKIEQTKQRKTGTVFPLPSPNTFVSFSRPLRVSQLPRSWKKISLTRHANLLVNICCGLQRIHKSDR